MPWINRGDTLSGTAFFPLQDAVAERLAYIAAISGPGESFVSVLAQTYCEFMPEASGETGRLMAGVVISTVERYAGWFEVAEDNPEGFATSFTLSLARSAAPGDKMSSLERFTCMLEHITGSETPPVADQTCEDEARRAVRTLLSIPASYWPAADENDAAALAELDMRGGEYGRAAWEAMALYTASCENERAPETTLRQFTVAACGSQAAIATACTARKGRLTADRARRRLRAAQLVTLALLAAIESAALAVLFAGSITTAAAACRRALMLCAAGTPVINKTAALMLGALDVYPEPLEVEPEYRSTPETGRAQTEIRAEYTDGFLIEEEPDYDE